MTLIFEDSYTVPLGHEPLTHARIAHSFNWLSGGTASASGTAAGYFANAPLNTLTYEKWKPDDSIGFWEYDHGSAAECDYCCIAAHNLSSVGASLSIEYYDGSEWIDLVLAGVPQSDSPIMAIFRPITSQRWRITVGLGSSEPEIGVVKFGKALQMQRMTYQGHTPVDFGRNTILRSNYSETGEYLGRTKQRTYLTTAFQWDHLTAAWVRDNWGDMQRAVEAEPFWIAWRPSSYDEVGFFQTDQVPVASNTGPRDMMSTSLQVRARGWD